MREATESKTERVARIGALRARPLRYAYACTV